MVRSTPVIAAVAVVAAAAAFAQSTERTWLAGDSHIHSQWSPGYSSEAPPQPIVGGDAIYPTAQNARRAREFGLSWMVTTDHGGPNHSQLNQEQAYAELRESRMAVPEVLQFYGMELNMPAMDHHTLMIPRSDDESKDLFEIESRFDANEVWPRDPRRNTEEAASRALTFINAMRRLPLMFANHPARSATGLGRYGLDEPREFRRYNDLAPEIYRGMEGAPGHQAGALQRDRSVRQDGFRGAYRNDGARTMGGFDQMTSRVGGLWDALLGEGRRFWIVATSDSHVHFTEPSGEGSDFWPGEYQKTYVLARKTYDDILDGLRQGRIFAVAGDLVSELDVTVSAGSSRAIAGETLVVPSGATPILTVRLVDPASRNANGDNPSVERVDIIVGDVSAPLADRNADGNRTTRVLARITAKEWTASGNVRTFRMNIPVTARRMYVRVRGTSTSELEPSMDPPGENPWADLWFYSNPAFIEVR